MQTQILGPHASYTLRHKSTTLGSSAYRLLLGLAYHRNDLRLLFRNDRSSHRSYICHCPHQRRANYKILIRGVYIHSMFIMIALILQNLQRLFNAYLLPTHLVDSPCVPCDLKQLLLLLLQLQCFQLSIDVATSYKYTQFKLQNAIYAFHQNITAFQAFVMSCFGQ